MEGSRLSKAMADYPLTLDLAAKIRMSSIGHVAVRT